MKIKHITALAACAAMCFSDFAAIPAAAETDEWEAGSVSTNDEWGNVDEKDPYDYVDAPVDEVNTPAQAEDENDLTGDGNVIVPVMTYDDWVAWDYDGFVVGDWYPVGDVTRDRKVDATDASAILTYYSVMSTEPDKVAWHPNKIATADVDGSGMIDASDASYILGYYAYASTRNPNWYLMTMAEYIEDSKKVKFIYSENYGRIEQEYDKKNEKLHISWDTVGCAKGYIVKLFYHVEDGEEYKRIDLVEERITDTEYTFDLPWNIITTSYQVSFSYTPYGEKSGLESLGYEVFGCIDDIRALINYTDLKPHDSYPLYNIKGDTPKKTGTYYVTAEDKKIIDKFAKEHFTDDMTNYDKLEYTLHWLNENVTYANGNEGWNTYDKIAGCSWVKACFEKKLGQCIQYNGAMAEMMAYMGYDVYMLEMWLDKPNKAIQHFRAEVNIEGHTFGFEVGNAVETPGWWWMFRPIDSSIVGYPRG